MQLVNSPLADRDLLDRSRLRKGHHLDHDDHDAEHDPDQPRASTSSALSLDLPSLQPLSHQHPLLSAQHFDSDAFLLSRIHIPLDELRAELREYLGLLREELIQLINDDYEDFISLGTGLRGESERLRRLETPMAALYDQVEVRAYLAVR